LLREVVDSEVRWWDSVCVSAYDAFVKKWPGLCPAVATSLEEAGLELLTFYDFPRAMWKSLRTTNTVENLNREFRRRTKTQASFGTEDAALTVLDGLVALGHAYSCARSMDTSSCLRSSPRNGSNSRKSVEWVNRSAAVTPSKQFPQESGRILRAVWNIVAQNHPSNRERRRCDLNSGNYCRISTCSVIELC
jgi:hypothetical protein